MVRDAEDHPHQQGPAHHLDRRLRRLALRQEPAARRPGHRHRRGGRHPLHRPPAQGHLRRLHHPAALPGHRDAGQGGGRPGPGRQRALRGRGAGRLHRALRHPPPRRHRAARGAGGGHRLRVDRQAGGLPGGGRLRHLRRLRRLRRHLRAGGAGARPRGAHDRARGRRRLRHLGLPHLPLDALHPLPAPPVPDLGGGERRRGPHREGHLALPALPPAHQRLRAAGGPGRADALRRRAASTPTPSCSPCPWPSRPRG